VNHMPGYRNACRLAVWVLEGALPILPGNDFVALWTIGSDAAAEMLAHELLI
jgi:hypothetical protein